MIRCQGLSSWYWQLHCRNQVVRVMLHFFEERRERMEGSDLSYCGQALVSDHYLVVDFKIFEALMFSMYTGNYRIWNRKLRHLKAIETSVIENTHSIIGPRTSQALLTSSAVAFCLNFVPVAFEKFGLLSEWKSSVWLVLAILAWPVVFGLVYRFSSTSRCWIDEIDRLMSAYDPIDVDAYQYLQSKTREFGYLDNHEIRIWIGFEQRAIEIAAGWRNLRSDGFLSKVLK